MIGMPKLMFFIAMFGGTVAYHMLSLVFDYFMQKFFKLHALNGLDNFFLQNEDQTTGNLSCYVKFRKFEYEKMKAFIYNKLLQMPPRARTKLVEVFGKRYWLEMSPEEFQHRFEIMCTRCDTVKTKRDFENFLRDKMEIRVPMEKGP
jgi:hypothetical protein